MEGKKNLVVEKVRSQESSRFWLVQSRSIRRLSSNIVNLNLKQIIRSEERDSVSFQDLQVRLKVIGSGISGKDSKTLNSISETNKFLFNVFACNLFYGEIS